MDSATSQRQSAAGAIGHLPKLPVELIELVARHVVDTPDLSALRLTCRDLYNKSLDYFGKEYFTRKQFMLSYFSLQALVDISAHPVLSKYIRRVIIGTDHLVRREVPNPNDATGSIRAERLDQLLLEMRYMKSLALDLPLLINAFTNLRTSCEEVELRNYNQARRRDGRKWYSYGALTIKAETGVEPEMSCHYQDPEKALSRTFTVLLSAITASKLELKQLLVTLRPLEYEKSGLQEHAFYIPDSLRPPLAATFSKLKTLTLGFDADHRFIGRESVLASMFRFLNLLPSLVKLRLNAIYMHHHSNKPFDLTAVTLPHLESLELGYIFTDQDTIVRTVKQFPRLWHLGIFRMRLMHGSWKQALAELAALQRLRSLTMLETRENLAQMFNVGFKKDDKAEPKDIRELDGIKQPVSFMHAGVAVDGDLKEWMLGLRERLVVADRSFFLLRALSEGMIEIEDEEESSEEEDWDDGDDVDDMQVHHDDMDGSHGDSDEDSDEDSEED